jgi:hypothetical protein
MEPSVDFDWEQVDRDLGEIAAAAPNDYREASLRFLKVIHTSLEWSFTASPPTPEVVAMMLATGHPRANGRSMTDWAAQLGVTRALISTLARRFCKEAGLPPSAYMRTEEASRVARKIREHYIETKKAKQ